MKKPETQDGMAPSEPPPQLGRALIMPPRAGRTLIILRACHVPAVSSPGRAQVGVPLPNVVLSPRSKIFGCVKTGVGVPLNWFLLILLNFAADRRSR
jgi:hypothetical protein